MCYFSLNFLFFSRFLEISLKDKKHFISLMFPRDQLKTLPCQVLFLFLFFQDFFDMDQFKILFGICYRIASVFLFFGHEACGILTPWPEIKPSPLALGSKVLTTRLPEKSLYSSFNVEDVYISYEV